MSKQKEALRLALGALETGHSAVYGTSQTARAITAIREALADSALERIAENERELGLDYMEPAQQQIDLDALGIPHGTPFQPAQQEPVVWMYVNKSTHETKFQKHMMDFVDHSLWSEVPLYGEPLANHELQCVCGAVWLGDELVHLPDKRPPAQRKPLTDEEIIQFAQEWPAETNDWESHIDFARAIEAAHGIKGGA